MSEKSEIKEKIAIEKRMCLMGSNEPVHTSNSQTDTVIRKLGIYDPECDSINEGEWGEVKQDFWEFKNHDSINEVYTRPTLGYPNQETIVSWSSRMHPDTIQPLESLYFRDRDTFTLEGQGYAKFVKKSYFFNLNKPELNIDGLNINFESNPGLADLPEDSPCGGYGIFNTNDDPYYSPGRLQIEGGNTSFGYFGICVQNEREYILEPNKGIKTVHKFTDNTSDNSYHGQWSENSPESSDFNKLEFGNFYLFEIYEDVDIPGIYALMKEHTHELITHLENCNPESDNPVCCDGFDQVITTTGNQIDLQDITISGFDNGGKLCMSNLNYDDASAITDSVTTIVDPTGGSLFGGKITLTVQPKNSIIRYTSINGTCYQGTLSGNFQTLEEVQ